MQNTSFLESQTILRALEFALAKGAFREHPMQKKTATALVRTMKSTRSVSGRHQQLTTMLKKGASIDELIGATGSSRRTIFRYLNHLEAAGVNLSLANGQYRLKG